MALVDLLTPVDPADIPIDQLQFIHFWSETGNIDLSAEQAGLKTSPHSLLNRLGDKTTKLGRYLTQIKVEKSTAIAITIEKKRMKLWRMVELCTEEVDGLPRKAGIALKCLDMLNKMDGHYAPVKAQVQTQAHIVRFDQHI